MFNYVIFTLSVILSVLNLIDVQYLQNVVFSFEMGSNGQISPRQIPTFHDENIFFR